MIIKELTTILGTGYERYYVSTEGNFYKKLIKTGKLKQLKVYQNHLNHYLYIGLGHGIYHKTFRAHKLVALAFIDNPNQYDQINHIDGNKTNNSITNLEWCDLSYNIKHAYKNNLWNPIKFQKTSKPVNVYDLDHNLLAECLTIRDAAKFIGCSISSITRAINQYNGYLKRLKYFIEPCNDYPIASH